MQAIDAAYLDIANKAKEDRMNINREDMRMMEKGKPELLLLINFQVNVRKD